MATHTNHEINSDEVVQMTIKSKLDHEKEVKHDNTTGKCEEILTKITLNKGLSTPKCNENYVNELKRVAPNSYKRIATAIMTEAV